MTSATSGTSTHSSVLVPRLRSSDLRFVSLNMFGRDTLKDLQFPAKPKIAGANIGLINDVTTLEVMIFDLRRDMLSILFWSYGILLEISGIYSELKIITANLFWTAFSSIFLNEDQLEKYANFVRSEKKGGLSSSTSTLEKANAFKNGFFELPLKLRYQLWKRTYRNRFPNSRLALQIAAGKGPFPETLGLIFDMFPLVVPPPPEVPAPYLDANKKMVIPDKKQVSIVLRARAEWSAAQHTHKATEILRVCSEASKVIVWSACIGVSNVVCHEINGYAWRNLKTLISLVKLELSSLDRKSGYKALRIPDYISFVNVATKQMKTLAEYSLQTDGLSQICVLSEEKYPLPEESPILNSGDFNKSSPTVSASSAIPVRLTVFLTSGYEWTDYSRIVTLTKEILGAGSGSEKSSQSGTEDKFANVSNISNAYYPSPEVLLKFTSARQIPESISGFPLHPSNNDLKTFSIQTRPANFPDFVRALNGYQSNSSMEATYGMPPA